MPFHCQPYIRAELPVQKCRKQVADSIFGAYSFKNSKFRAIVVLMLYVLTCTSAAFGTAVAQSAHNARRHSATGCNVRALLVPMLHSGP